MSWGEACGRGCLEGLWDFFGGGREGRVRTKRFTLTNQLEGERIKVRLRSCGEEVVEGCLGRGI